MGHSRTRASIRTDDVSPDAGAAAHKQSRALLDLALGVICGRTNRQSRIVAKFVEAMLSTARGKSGVHLADLHQLDDEQFERVVAALRYVRNTIRERHAGKVARSTHSGSRTAGDH